MQSVDQLLAEATLKGMGDIRVLLAALTLACRLALCNPRYFQQAGGGEWATLWQCVTQVDGHAMEQLDIAEASASIVTDECAPQCAWLAAP